MNLQLRMAIFLMVIQSLPISRKAQAKATQQAAKAYGMSMPELTTLAKECIEETKSLTKTFEQTGQIYCV
jgi:hypothetical protein